MNQSRRRNFTFFLVVAAFLTSPISLFADTVETLLVFDPAVPDTPESLVLDRDGNTYISMALTGEIRKITPDFVQSTLAMMPIGAPCGPLPVLASGLAIDRRQQIFVAVTACDPANSGIWKVDREDGRIELVANTPSNTLLNGLAVRRGYIYAADSFGGMIWRVRKNGGELEVWSDDPLLQIPEGSPFPGPNGVRAFRNKVFVAVSATGTIVKIPFVGEDNAAGEGVVHATLPGGQGCDEFAFDRRRRIYCTTNPFNTVVRLNRNGTSEILLDGEDGLDGPTSVAFGRLPGTRRELFITNASFPFLNLVPEASPSLMRLTFDQTP